jgi:peroxiredoxin
MIKPTQSVPDLSVETVGGDTWRLSDQSPESFTVIEFYRGYHCPRCKVQLLDLDQKLARFTERGCSVIAISMDGQDRAEKNQARMGAR